MSALAARPPALTPEDIDRLTADALVVKTVQYGKPVKCVLRYVGGPYDDREDEATVDRPWIDVPRIASRASWLDTSKLPLAAAFEYGRYRLIPVVVDGETPVFAAVWEGWK